MSERFSDEVLQRAWLAAWVTPGEFCAEDAAAMRAVLEGPTCEWVADALDSTDGIWETSCGQTFVFMDDGPTENKFAFCHHCGKRLSQRAHDE